ncbi:peptidase m20 [Leptolyngbya sp. Heron Island J]|uniref:M20 family metallopeptidase n=1 Tax=Leptolyngbya sp. Heron Island J TaxID=1385935 RepID=UPI0003B99F21|nr:M20 family metallopeptidase [Leptolyngbya sp. Heron Island J]ESA37434.1 peptidase m20 [Leptolyngbya sp. Heron Island J]
MTLTPIPAQTGRLLLDYFYQHRNTMVETVQALAKIESPSTVPASQQPLLDRLQTEFERRGLRVRRLSGERTGGHLLAISKQSSPEQPKQLMLGHCDTVWPLETLATMPIKRHQGKLYGPGVYDMKAGITMMLFALEALQVLDLKPQVLPLVLLNSDEEIGSFESTRHVRRLAKICDRTFVLEPSLGPRGHLKTARKGVGHFTIEVIGQAAHAGLEPDKGASAILELSFIIQKLFDLNDPEAGITVNVGTIDGGIRPNVIAPVSRAEVDVRVLHQSDVHRIEQAILTLQPNTVGTQLKIKGKIGRAPLEKTPRNQQLWQLAQQTATDLGFDLEERTVGGGSDGNTTSLYTATLDGMGAVGDSAHAPGEFIYIDPLVERTALLTQLLLAPALPLL